MNQNTKGKRATLMALVILGMLLVPMTASMAQMPGTQPTPMPELEITEIEFSDVEPMEGDVVTISVTIENLNDTMPVNDITASLYIDFELVHNFTAIDLDAGASTTLEYEWTAKSFTHNITAMPVFNDMPIQDGQAFAELYVEPEPVGDAPTLLMALGVIGLAVLIIAVIPSIWGQIRK